MRRRADRAVSRPCTSERGTAAASLPRPVTGSAATRTRPTNRITCGTRSTMQQGDDQPADLGERVVDPGERPREVERQHAVALVAAEELGCLRRAEQHHQGDRSGRGRSSYRTGEAPRARAPPPAPGEQRRDADREDGRQDREPGERERRDLGPTAAADPVAPTGACCGTARVDGARAGRGAGRRSPGSRGRRCSRRGRRRSSARRSGRARGRARSSRRPAGGGRGRARHRRAGRVVRNRSSRPRRRCSRRTSGRPRSARASRTRSYGRSSSIGDDDGPAVDGRLQPALRSARRPGPPRPPRPRPRG